MNDKVRYRMCAGCRGRFHQNDLIRICKTEDGIFVDKNVKLGGRGAYICPDKACFQKARKGKRLERALETAIPDSVYDAMENELK